MFIIYDLTLLFLFAIFVSVFLYSRRKNLKKEGLLFLYKTSWGIRLIDKVGNKYKKTIKFLSYVSITLGYFLMAGIIYLFGKLIWVYVTRQDVVRAIKVPPIIPLIPYLPQIFKLSFLPEFYFTYWIVILAVVAITHEFAHGIFAAYNKVKIKTTGFGFFPFFLPVFLAAFVELDEEVMAKKDKIPQMAILSAGTFANVLTAIFFLAVLWIFFSLAFIPSGIIFNSYSYSQVNVLDIYSIDGIQVTNFSHQGILDLLDEEEFSKIGTLESGYLVSKELFEKQEKLFEDEKYFIAYDDAPAINAKLRGIIREINGVKINSWKKLGEEIYKYSPGENVSIITNFEDRVLEYNIVLGENPEDENSPWLGIGFADSSKSGITGKMIGVFSSFKKPGVNYKPIFDGISLFIYNLLWWLILITLSVALVNMLPVGIFDGGRFFYLTIAGITGSEKIAKRAFAIMTYLFLFLLVLIMVAWALSFF